MDAARDVSLIKTNEIKKRLVEGFLPFLAQPIDRKPYNIDIHEFSYGGNKLKIAGTRSITLDGTPYLEPDKQGVTIGTVGINETLKAHTGSELHESADSWRFGLKLVDFMRRTVDEYTKETGVYFGLVQSPAESAAIRLAQMDLKRYDSKAVFQGNPKKSENGSPAIYYTNSSHVNVDANVPLGKRIAVEASFHPLYNGGTILHVFLGEAYPDADALWKLTHDIATKTLTGYFSYTKDMTICKACRSVHYGLLDACPKCSSKGGDLEHWSRITGYYQEVSGWNAGKKEELRRRYRYEIGKEAAKEQQVAAIAGS
jgi:ribonucleoside-triphosphate reductase